ncbi:MULTISPECIES: GntR family transcriptional regulator [Gordonia]|uniref:GntR family transcriptional regulator n=2 Tax=Gordonia TaxID=2053 RepID=A0A9X3I5M8_9ACTN|nr:MULTISPECIES: GntR family transcriptional regulator [Gordonia]MCF3937898.1 GntR family transcriptional regulator [Gordonia tangerina]MCX2964664.1 GntR family transcriptional regulator [Gordonia aquimaris]
MLIRIDPSSRVPLYEQIASSLRGSIAREEIGGGERLPAARDLAASLDINLHTVLRAYQLLRDDGVVELRRGRGAVVTHAAAGRAELADAVEGLIRVARRLGMSADATAAEIHGRWTL